MVSRSINAFQGVPGAEFIQVNQWVLYSRHRACLLLLYRLNAAASRASPTQPDSQTVDIGEFEQSLEDVEQLLVALKQRYTQVQQDLRASG